MTASTAAKRSGIFGSTGEGGAGRAALWGLALAAGSWLSPDARAEERLEYRQVVMGVEARLVLHAPDEATARTAAVAAFDRLVALDDELSDWRVDSGLERLVARAGEGPVPVSDDMLAVLSRAVALAQATDGAFDPTVAPVVALWRRARAEGVLPDEQALAAAHARVGHQRVHVDAEAGLVALQAGTELDLGAVAKGWAADQALAELTSHGCPASLVDLGGDLSIGAPPPGRDGWRVSVGCARRVLELSRCAVASSGSTEQFLELDGVRLSHVIDPRTGRALPDAPCCSVVAEDGATADALASAAMVLGPLAAPLLAAAFPTATLYVDDVESSTPAPVVAPAVAAPVAAVAPAAPADELVVTLFNGQDLSGWTETGGRYDGRARWSVEDGEIVGRTAEDGAGGLLYTEQPFTSFDLSLEVKLDHPFDSGVFVRMVPPGGGRGAQITLDDRPGGEIGAVYADGFLEHQRDGDSPWRVDEWNEVRVRCTGFDMHLQAWINGVEVTDFQVERNAEGYAPTGRIGIQVHGGGAEQGHGGEARFRDLWLVKQPLLGLAPGEGLLGDTPEEFAEGLDGWRASRGFARRGEGAPTTTVTDGVLDLRGALRSERELTDLALSFNLQLDEGGFFLLTLRDVDMGPRWSPLVPILAAVDDPGFGPGTPSAVITPGRWAHVEVLLHERRLAVAVDGQTVFDRQGPGVVIKDAAGPISLSAFGGGARLEGLRIAELSRDG